MDIAIASMGTFYSDFITKADLAHTIVDVMKTMPEVFCHFKGPNQLGVLCNVTVVTGAS